MVFLMFHPTNTNQYIRHPSFRSPTFSSCLEFAIVRPQQRIHARAAMRDPGRTPHLVVVTITPSVRPLHLSILLSSPSCI